MSSKIEALKQALDAAVVAHNTERDRLAASGLKSAARYEALKPLKAVVDAANAAYVKAAHGQINRKLSAIIAADKPARQAAALARSPWKQAKAAAKIA